MKTLAFNTSTSTQDCDSLMIGVNEQGKLIGSDPQLNSDSVLQSAISEAIADQDFTTKPGAQLLIRNLAGFKRVFFVAIGDPSQLSAKKFLELLKQTTKNLLASGAQCLYSTLMLELKDHDANWCLYQNVVTLQAAQYGYQHPSRGEHSPVENHLTTVKLATSVVSANAVIAQAQASALGMSLTQDLANMPANFCTPSYLAKTAQDLADHYGFRANILDRAEMERLGMGSLLSVAQGSEQPPKLICLEYQGGEPDEAPIALVGKGVTFDTGGISLKPGAAMDEMKYDMGGAATVLGVFKALGELKPKVNVVGVIPSTENMPSGTAVKPGDVVTSMSGQTIEILNTDAEGRLILCDALTYAQQTYQPKQIIDIATLTGACIIALGHHVSGVLGNHQPLVDALLSAGEQTYDRFWQLPLGEEWDEQLKSNFADMANIGGRPAGTITAAQFLARFTQDIEWAHLDIAGTAWTSGTHKGATGRPVPALMEFLNH